LGSWEGRELSCDDTGKEKRFDLFSLRWGELVVGAVVGYAKSWGMTGNRKHLRESVFAGSAPSSVEHSDAVVFGRERLGFIADLKQQLVLRAGISRGLLNCTRQWGEVDGGGGASCVHAGGPVGGGVFAVFAAERFVMKTAVVSNR